MKKRRISTLMLYFALLVGHFGKSIHVLYIVWGYSHHFITLGSIFLRITIIASVRGTKKCKKIKKFFQKKF